jgi:hypothetical protein
LAAGKAGEALEHYQAAANGPFATDPALLLGSARAQFALGNYAAADATLCSLFTASPQARQQPEPALLYARTLAALDASGTHAAFEQTLTCASGAAPRCLFADWLARHRHLPCCSSTRSESSCWRMRTTCLSMKLSI